MAERTLREKLERKHARLLLERSSWGPHAQELSRYLLPRSGRFTLSDRNRGDRRHNAIYDNTGTRASRILAAGMMAGMSSPALPWFKLTTGDADLDKRHTVKLWLTTSRDLMLRVFAQSNTYRALHSVYSELGVFGTGATIPEPHFDNVLHQHALTWGEYCIGTDFNGTTDTLYREFQQTVGSVVKRFGLANLAPTTRNLYDQGNTEEWVTLVQAIEPRPPEARDPKLPRGAARSMPFGSYYFEPANPDKGKMLGESGYRSFPALAPRWDVSGGDIYGNSPGMEALGDVKQLQHQQLRKGQAIDYQTRPPLQVPTNMKGREPDMLPGGVTYYDTTGGPTSGIKPLFDAPLRLDYLLTDMQDVRERINASFYVDLFLMVSRLEQTGRTATEIAERHEEKLLVLGPVLERLHNELLDPLIDTTFERLAMAGALPPPPPEMDGQEIRVEFVSMLAQAQRAVGAASVDRYLASMGAIYQFKPEVADKLDPDGISDFYGDVLGVDPHLIVPTEQAVIVRQERARQQAQAAAAEQANQLADTASKLGNTPGVGQQDTALTDVMSLFSGYQSPASTAY